MTTSILNDEKYHLLLDEDDLNVGETARDRPRPSQIWTIKSTLILLGTLCTFSVILNIFVLVQKPHHEGTKWAHLVYDVPTPIYSSTEYGPAIGTEAERDQRWAAIDFSEGIIALPDHLALQYGLPLSERFPWDQTQGVYLLGAHHGIHCLKRIYEFISDTHKGRTSSRPYEHILHCLDSLLQDVYCHADDTPWIELPPEPERKKYVQFQTRQCRSWDKLMAWARQYNACYQSENIKDAAGLPTDDVFEHFKYCPEGSVYMPIVEKFFAQKAQGINDTKAYDVGHGGS